MVGGHIFMAIQTTEKKYKSQWLLSKWGSSTRLLRFHKGHSLNPMNFEVHIDETSGFFLEFWLKFLAENLSLIESPSPAPNGPEVEGPRKSSVKQLRLEITSRFQAQVRSELENLSLTTTDAKKKPQKRK